MVTALANLVHASVTNREGGDCMGDYPGNTLAGTGWDSIALAVKVRADWCCEHCLHPHDLESGHVLTVHHLDGDPATLAGTGNCVPENLVALCQRCHSPKGTYGLHIQARYHPLQMTMPFYRPWWMVLRGLGG